MNWKGFGRKHLWPRQDIIPTSSWRDWGRPRKSSVRVAGVLDEICTKHLWNNLECYHCTSLLSPYGSPANHFILSCVWVTIDRVWTGDWNYCTLNTWLMTTFYSLLQHAQSLVSLLCRHQSLPGNGFQQRTFALLWVPELSPCLSYQLLTAAAHNNQTAAVL
jgi:hypothetical protein